MVNIIVVEDDEIVRDSIVHGVDWRAHGIHIAGDAGDGLEGLELIQRIRPDIVISDIRMPFMDGLELAERTLSLFPHTKFVFLTAYEDFNYAKEALRLKIYEYVMKYADRRQVLEAVLRANRELLEERKLHKRNEQSLALLRTELFRELTSAGSAPTHIERLMDEAEITCRGDRFMVAVVHAEWSDATPRHTLLEFINDHLYALDLGWAFTHSDNSRLTMLFNFRNREEPIEAVYDVFDRIEAQAGADAGLRIGVSHIHVGIHHLHIPWNEALKALEIGMLLSQSGVTAYDSINYSETSQHELFNRIVAIVDQEYMHKLTLHDLANRVHISHTYICALFRKYKACTLSHYVIELRIAKAKDLLTHTNKKVYEIAELLGYTNPQYFSILFKKWTGCSPVKFRQQGERQPEA